MSGQVAKPKIYINYIDYFRAAGLGVVVGDSGTNINEDYSDIFTYNPSNTKEFTITSIGSSMKFKAKLGDGTGEAAKLVQSINFAAYLNHNIEDLDVNYITMYGMDVTGNLVSINTTDIHDTGGKNGFRLISVDVNDWDASNCYGVVFKVSLLTETIPFRLGSVIAGRTFSFPHNANLSMNIDYTADGIKKRRTLGGRDIVDINYYKQPDWDGSPPFIATNTNKLSSTSHIGRRSWALTFSFLTADNTFPQDMGEGFMFDNAYTDGEETSWTNWGTENITSHFMTLTMNGQLPFLFQPDDTKATFAMCRLRSNSFSVQQSAPNLYTCKMTFDETW